jgi:hypothetical protein
LDYREVARIPKKVVVTIQGLCYDYLAVAGFHVVRADREQAVKSFMRLIVGTVCVLAFAAPTWGAAKPIVFVPSVSTSAPASGSVTSAFELLLKFNNVNPTPSIAAFFVKLKLSPGSPQTTLVFSSPFVQKPANYIFDPSGSAGRIPTNPSGNPSTAYVINGQGDTPGGTEQPLNADFGLIKVPYTITGPIGSTQTFTITVDTVTSSLTDGFGIEVPFDVQNGTFTINPAPEPAYSALIFGTLAILLRRPTARRRV